jgi:hypothetical protein
MGFNRTYNPPLYAPVIQTTDPTQAPVVPGATYVNTTTMSVFVAVGSGSSADWKLVTPQRAIIANNINVSGFKTITYTITAQDLQRGHFDLVGSIDQVFYIARERVMYSEGSDWKFEKKLNGAKIKLEDSMLPGSDEALEAGNELYISCMSSAKYDVSAYAITAQDLARGYLLIPFAVSKVLYVARQRVLYYDGQDWTAEVGENETRIIPAGALGAGGVEALEPDEIVFISVLI